MNVWVFNKPPQDIIAFIYDSLKNGISRFGWGWFDSADLHVLETRAWQEYSEVEKEAWHRANFLLGIEPGDWIVHVNVPQWGQCAAAQVNRPYSFGENTPYGGFRHTIGIDAASLITFDRNDRRVLPNISRRLKLQGAHYQIRAIDDFLNSIENLKNKPIEPSDTPKGLYYLRGALKTPLADITALIHRNHPGKTLEEFLALILRKIPNVNGVEENGSGWSTDHGADLIVKYTAGLPLAGLQTEEKLVVQVKSHTGIDNDLWAVEQIKTGIEKYNAQAGLLITTGEASDELKQKIEETAADINKSIGLLSGEDVARFVLKYGADELLEA